VVLEVALRRNCTNWRGRLSLKGTSTLRLLRSGLNGSGVNSLKRPVDHPCGPHKADGASKIHVHGATRRKKSSLPKDADGLNCLLELHQNLHEADPASLP
jgi:hypothetical protein